MKHARTNWQPSLATLITLAMAISAVMFLPGCAAQPETWKDATTRQFRVPVQAQRLAKLKSAGTAAQRPLVWNAATDPYDWKKGYAQNDYAQAGEGFDLLMRNPDFPNTYIKEVHVSLTDPNHRVFLVWTGPHAASAPAGPWRSSPGRGNGQHDCDTIKGSNTTDSNCTPKGVFRVKGFSDHLRIVTGCLYATWVIHKPRFIALHSSGDIPEYPASGGCIRLPYEAAKIIHNNSIAGVTLVSITGKWTDPRIANE